MKLNLLIAEAVRTALIEDLGCDNVTGDVTTKSLVGTERGAAIIKSNDAGIVAGTEVAQAVFEALDREAVWRAVDDGASVTEGRVIAEIEGSLQAILAAERTALNFLAHLSGIATLTRQFVDKVAGSGAKIFDTRKTLPGLRALEKYAVTVGGGHNHRFGLFDGILIKDNHLVNRDLPQAVGLLHEAQTGLPIEVEVETLAQLEPAIEAGANIVLLDNMDTPTIAEAIHLAKGKVIIEVSGGIRLDNVGEIAQAGPQRISVGAITQSASPLDCSLDVKTAGSI